MLYTIEGFSVQKLVEYGFDGHDAIILRWFHTFMVSPDMEMIIIDEKPYYWVSYTHLLQEIPCINISNSKSFQRRFNKYVAHEILLRYIRKRTEGKQTRAYYHPTEKFHAMMSQKATNYVNILEMEHNIYGNHNVVEMTTAKRLTELSTELSTDGT